MRRLRHRNIVGFRGVCISEGRGFLIMELMEGGELIGSGCGFGRMKAGLLFASQPPSLPASQPPHQLVYPAPPANPPRPTPALPPRASRRPLQQDPDAQPPDWGAGLWVVRPRQEGPPRCRQVGLFCFAFSRSFSGEGQPHSPHLYCNTLGLGLRLWGLATVSLQAARSHILVWQERGLMMGRPGGYG